jgi:starch synthase/alpha-amylase
MRQYLPDERVHLAADRAFFYLQEVYDTTFGEKIKAALAFQREVINNVIPWVRPDLIHCNDWTTGLLPAAARKMGIPCLFTVHDMHTATCLLADAEDRGIDTAAFWEHLFFTWMPDGYESTRTANPVDFLASGIFAAHFVNTVSPTFLQETVQGRYDFVPQHIGRELANKVACGCAAGILNAPDPSFDPRTDNALARNYGAADHAPAKALNKTALQHKLGLMVDRQAPLFYWPFRRNPIQKGCQLLTQVLYDVVAQHRDDHLQAVVVANGEFQGHCREIVDRHDLHDRIAVVPFDASLARLAYGAADFLLMPSRYEPCGLPLMTGAIYGALPVAHRTGGIRDTLRHLSGDGGSGNGFLFEIFDAQGLRWAMEEALLFHRRPSRSKVNIISRIMESSAARFNHSATAGQYIALYERMLQRPLVDAGGTSLKDPIRREA